MKWLTVSLLIIPSLMAQESNKTSAPTAPPERPPLVDVSSKERTSPPPMVIPHAQRSRRHGTQQKGYLGTWLEHLRETDPVEHRRILRLREEDPKAFQKMERERLSEGKLNATLEKDPELQRHIRQIAPGRPATPHAHNPAP